MNVSTIYMTTSERLQLHVGIKPTPRARSVSTLLLLLSQCQRFFCAVATCIPCNNSQISWPIGPPARPTTVRCDVRPAEHFGIFASEFPGAQARHLPIVAAHVAACNSSVCWGRRGGCWTDSSRRPPPHTATSCRPQYARSSRRFASRHGPVPD